MYTKTTDNRSKNLIICTETTLGSNESEKNIISEYIYILWNFHFHAKARTRTKILMCWEYGIEKEMNKRPFKTYDKAEYTVLLVQFVLHCVSSFEIKATPFSIKNKHTTLISNTQANKEIKALEQLMQNRE